MAGCVPWPTLVQPGIEFRVTDTDGSPVENATVKLARYSLAFVPESHVESRVTDPSGRASFSSERKWQVPTPETGRRGYNWSWCVDAPGYTPVLANDLRSAGYSRTTDVTLERGSAQCEWSGYPYAYSVIPE
jgi:hypothetical protein